MLKLIKNSDTLVYNFFAQSKALVSKPKYKIFPHKIVVSICYFQNVLDNDKYLSDINKNQLSAKKTAYSITDKNLNALANSLVKLFSITGLPEKATRKYNNNLTQKNPDGNKSDYSAVFSSTYPDQGCFHFPNENNLTYQLHAGNNKLRTLNNVNNLSQVADSFHSPNEKQSARKSNKLIQVEFLRIKYPYADSSILAQYLTLNAGKYTFTRIHKTVFNQFPIVSSISCLNASQKGSFSLSEWSLDLQSRDHSLDNLFSFEAKVSGSNVAGSSDYDPDQGNLDHTLVTSITPSSSVFASLPAGIKLELAGRLITQKSIPRKTVENIYTGSLGTTLNFENQNRGNKKKGTLLNFSQYASKNKLGALTVKVWLSQRVL